MNKYIVLTECLFGKTRTLSFEFCETMDDAKKLARLIVKAYRENPQSVFYQSGDKDEVIVEDFLECADGYMPTIILYTKVGSAKHDFKLSVCCSSVNCITYSNQTISNADINKITISNNAILTRDKLKDNI